MSYHLDSPIAREDIRLDITDLYLFRGEKLVGINRACCMRTGVQDACYLVGRKTPNPEAR
jgi:hypothetical protein